ncbi:MAG: hypothetical protein AAFZ92_07655 [Pseudomonadota bacterium]
MSIHTDSIELANAYRLPAKDFPDRKIATPVHQQQFSGTISSQKASYIAAADESGDERDQFSYEDIANKALSIYRGSTTYQGVDNIYAGSDSGTTGAFGAARYLHDELILADGSTSQIFPYMTNKQKMDIQKALELIYFSPVAKYSSGYTEGAVEAVLAMSPFEAADAFIGFGAEFGTAKEKQALLALTKELAERDPAAMAVIIDAIYKFDIPFDKEVLAVDLITAMTPEAAGTVFTALYEDEGSGALTDDQIDSIAMAVTFNRSIDNAALMWSYVPVEDAHRIDDKLRSNPNYSNTKTTKIYNAYVDLTGNSWR